jgi:hypothetical protein
LCEAEYNALTNFLCKILWIQQIIVEIGLGDSLLPTVVHEDNKGCIAVANFDANSNSKRMKHVEIQLHFIWDVIKNGKIILQYTPTKNMLADFLTKAVPLPELIKPLIALGLFCLEGRGGVLMSKLNAHALPEILVHPYLSRSKYSSHRNDTSPHSEFLSYDLVIHTSFLCPDNLAFSSPRENSPGSLFSSDLFLLCQTPLTHHLDISL